jgi:hypothetical protein
MAEWRRIGTGIAAVGATATLAIPVAASGGAHASAARAASPSVATAATTTAVGAASVAAAAQQAATAHGAASTAARAASVAAAGSATRSSTGTAAAPMALNSRTGGTASTKCNDGTVSYTPTTLWPPNHKMQTITITYTDNDNDGDSTRITVGMITDNQAAADGSGELQGSGQPTDQQGLDWAGMGNTGTGQDGGSAATTTAQVRAERSGTDPAGRTYDIKVTCNDMGGTSPMEMSGVMQTVDLFVTVPHDQGNG